MADPAYVRELKAFARGPITVDDLTTLEQEMYGENDRASAVVLGSIVESNLTEYLHLRLRMDLNSDDKRRLFDYEGPLGTFAAKITMAYAIGAIGSITRSDLNLIRILRNEFAHSRRHLSFEVAQVAAVCAKLRTPDLPGAFIPFGSFSRPTGEEWASDKNHPRTRYRSACHSISYNMIESAKDVTLSQLIATMTPARLP